MRRLAIALVFYAGLLSAQFTNVSPQSTNPVTVFTSQQTTAISSPVANIGQNVHIVRYSIAGADAQTFGIQIVASVTCQAGSYFQISAIATNVHSGILHAEGWFPCIAVQITDITLPIASTGVTATYNGTSATVPGPSGPYSNSGTLHKTIEYQADANLPDSQTYALPETASAVVIFQFNAPGCTGANFTIGTNSAVGNPIMGSFTPSGLINTAQVFVVPNLVGIRGTFSYTAGAGCAGNSYWVDIYWSAAELIAPASIGPAPVPPPAFADFLFNYATGLYEPRLVPTIYKIQSAVAVAAATDTTVWTPSAGKKFRVLGFSLTTSVNSPCNLRDNTAGTAFWRFIAVGMPGVQQTITVNGFLSAAANNVLAINCTNALTLDGVVWGVEQ